MSEFGEIESDLGISVTGDTAKLQEDLQKVIDKLHGVAAAYDRAAYGSEEVIDKAATLTRFFSALTNKASELSGNFENLKTSATRVFQNLPDELKAVVPPLERVINDLDRLAKAQREVDNTVPNKLQSLRNQLDIGAAKRGPEIFMADIAGMEITHQGMMKEEQQRTAVQKSIARNAEKVARENAKRLKDEAEAEAKQLSLWDKEYAAKDKLRVQAEQRARIDRELGAKNRSIEAYQEILEQEKRLTEAEKQRRANARNAITIREQMEEGNRRLRMEDERTRKRVEQEDAKRLSALRSQDSAVRAQARARDQYTQDSLAALSSAAGMLSKTGMLLTATVTAPIVGIGTAALVTAARIENVEKSLVAVSKSRKEALDLTNQLKAFSVQTPFDFSGAAGAAQKIKSFGFEAQAVVPILRAMGDTVAAVGGDESTFQRLAKVFGDVKAKGHLAAEEIRQFANIPFPIVQVLADKIGTSTEKVLEMVKKGQISATEAISTAIVAMVQKFGGTMEEKSQGLLGMFKNTKEKIEFALGDIGKSLTPLAKELLGWADTLAEKITNLARSFSSLPIPVQGAFGALAIGAAGIGPTLYVTGQLVGSLREILDMIIRIKAAGGIRGVLAGAGIIKPALTGVAEGVGAGLGAAATGVGSAGLGGTLSSAFAVGGPITLAAIGAYLATSAQRQDQEEALNKKLVDYQEHTFGKLQEVNIDPAIRNMDRMADFWEKSRDNINKLAAEANEKGVVENEKDILNFGIRVVGPQSDAGKDKARKSAELEERRRKAAIATAIRTFVPEEAAALKADDQFDKLTKLYLQDIARVANNPKLKREIPTDVYIQAVARYVHMIRQELGEITTPRPLTSGLQDMIDLTNAQRKAYLASRAQTAKDNAFDIANPGARQKQLAASMEAMRQAFEANAPKIPSIPGAGDPVQFFKLLQNEMARQQQNTTQFQMFESLKRLKGDTDEGLMAKAEKALKIFNEVDMASTGKATRDVKLLWVDAVESIARAYNMLPEQVSSSYRKIKNDTEDVVHKSTRIFNALREELFRSSFRAVREFGRNLFDVFFPKEFTNVARERLNDLTKGLNSGFQELVRKGFSNPEQALGGVIEMIKNAGSVAEANRIAIRHFGEASGPLLAKQIRDGAISASDLSKALHDATANLNGLVEAGGTRLNRLHELFRQLGRTIFQVFFEQAAIAIGKMIWNIKALHTAIEKVTDILRKIPVLGKIIDIVFPKPQAGPGGSGLPGIGLPSKVILTAPDPVNVRVVNGEQVGKSNLVPSIVGGISGVLGKILTTPKTGNKVFDDGSNSGGVVGNVAGVIGGVGQAAGAIGGAIKGVAQVAGSTIGAVTGIVTGAVTAISSVVSNFQQAHMNTALGRIEESTRYSKAYNAVLLETTQVYLPTLVSIHQRLMEFAVKGIAVYNAEGDQGLRIVGNLQAGSGGGQVNIYINGTGVGETPSTSAAIKMLGEGARLLLASGIRPRVA